MRFTDQAILLSLTKYSESTAICRLFGRDHGLISGAVRGAMSRKNKGSYQPGNGFQLEWSARLAEHLGSLKCELTHSTAAYCLNDPLRLAALNSALILTQSTLAEHDPHPLLYEALWKLLERLKHDADDWLADYCRYELLLLAESGFQLSLRRCAATGETENLRYVSPKSGSAVTAQAGKPYKDKLLPLPQFLLPPLPAGRGQGGFLCEARVSRVGEGDMASPKLAHTPQSQNHAKTLRQHMTDAEQKLWYQLRAKRFHNLKFRRQQPVGHYIVDFLCTEKRLIIEIDGGQHATKQACNDERTRFLQSKEFTVLRFWNNEVMQNLEGVLEVIAKSLALAPSPTRLTSAIAEEASLPYPCREREIEHSPKLTAHSSQLLQALTLTGYFLEHRLFASHGKPVPSARQQLVARVTRMEREAVDA